jgi:Tol biopolymer transport system component
VRSRRLRWLVISSADRSRMYTLNAPEGNFLGTPGLQPVWSPDESGLDYVVTRNGISNIWRQPLAGGSPVQITQFNAWKIFSFAWSRDGRWLSLAAGVNRTDAVLISRTQ